MKATQAWKNLDERFKKDCFGRPVAVMIYFKEYEAIKDNLERTKEQLKKLYKLNK
jgi:hypothetical protein